MPQTSFGARNCAQPSFAASGAERMPGCRAAASARMRDSGAGSGRARSAPSMLSGQSADVVGGNFVHRKTFVASFTHPHVTKDVCGRKRCNERRLCAISRNGRRLWQDSAATNVFRYIGGGVRGAGCGGHCEGNAMAAGRRAGTLSAFHRRRSQNAGEAPGQHALAGHPVHLCSRVRSARPLSARPLRRAGARNRRSAGLAPSEWRPCTRSR